MEYAPQPWSGTDAVARYSSPATPSSRSADWAPILARRASSAARIASRNPEAWRDASTNAVIMSASGEGGRSSPGARAAVQLSKKLPMPWRAASHMEPGSLRMATGGDSKVARHAGKSDDASAMDATMAADNTKGSTPGLSMRSSRTSSQVANAAATVPMTTPYAAMRRPEPHTRYR